MSSKADSNQTIPSAANYVSYYGLSEDPFANQREHFFVTQKLDKLLGLLDYITHFSQKLVVVSGPPGSGKTRILDYFVERLDDVDSCCRIEALALDTATQVMREINSQLGAATADTMDAQQLADSLRDYLVELEAESTTCLILVDNAHLFSISVLESLCELALSSPGTLHIVLFGQDSLVSMLKETKVLKNNEQLLYTHQLEAFSLADLKQYLCDLFVAIDDQDKNPFTDQDYTEIYLRSQGLPGQIRHSASRQMRVGIERLLAKNKKPRWVWVSGALIILSIAVLVIAFWGMEEKKPLVIAEVNKGKINSVTNNGTIKRIERRPIQPIVTEQTPLFEENDRVNNEKTLGFEIEGDLQSPLPATPELTKQVVSKEDKRITLENSSTQQTAERQEEKATMDSLPASSPVYSEQEVKDTVEPQSQLNEHKSLLAMHEQAILELDSASFTVQLLALRSEQGIQELIAGLPEPQRYYYFWKQHQGSPLYVLIYGSFASKNDALNATKALPGKLKPQSAWVRKIDGIQIILANRSKP